MAKPATPVKAPYKVDADDYNYRGARAQNYFAATSGSLQKSSQSKMSRRDSSLENSAINIPERDDFKNEELEDEEVIDFEEGELGELEEF